METWMILGICFIVAMASWVLGYISHKPKTDNADTAGTLIVCTDDPDGQYIFFESAIPIDELLKHETVKLSVIESPSQK